MISQNHYQPESYKENDSKSHEIQYIIRLFKDDPNSDTDQKLVFQVFERE